jgi:Domain of unknown function (DUF4331)
MSPMRRIVRYLCLVLTPLVLLATLMVGADGGSVGASSHREAPLISSDPDADNTDLYAFVSPEAPNTVTMIANYIPFEHPDGGPNYNKFSDDVLYEIHVDNVGDARSHVTYQFSFHTTTISPTTFLYNTGPIRSLTDTNWNVRQTYTMTEVVTPIVGAPTINPLGSNLVTPPVNIGSKSTPNYDTLASAAILPVAGGTIKVFAGQRDDPFWVDLGSIFDLLSLRGQASPIGYNTGITPGIDALSGFNVHSIAIQVPISRLLSSQNDPVIGVWATASRQKICTRGTFNIPTCGGGFVQISRLGNPLVNEVVLPRALKDAFNSIDPTVDSTLYTPGSLLQTSVLTPELQTLLKALYNVPNPGKPRKDLETVFLTGIPNVNKPTKGTNGSGAGIIPSEMLRLNTSLKPGTSPCPATPNYQLGILGSDACGFPNGRRLADNATYIELLAVGGAAYSLLTGDTSFTYNTALNSILTDSVTKNDKAFGSSFPYLASPHQGQEWDHQSITRRFLSVALKGFSGTPKVGRWSR